MPGRYGWFWLAASLAMAAGVAVPLAAAEKQKDIPGSRSTFVHHVELKDQRGNPIKASDDPALPFSSNYSCTKCHDYATVGKGWHFSATDPNAPAGRPGEPWFYTDRRTGTSLPLSYRDWPNTFRPGDVGILPWEFTLTFGRHFPGGGPGEMDETPDRNARWRVSEKLEINCLSCHSGDPQYDPTAWMLQIASQNLMWAGPGALASLGTVSGSAAQMPDFFDPFMGAPDEDLAKKAPTTHYDKARFDDKNRVFIDLPSRSPSGRCYSCHSLREVGKTAPDMWKTDPDVHMKAGLKCADCHRNGLDHAIRRGYEGEPGSDDPTLATLTCRGCHLGDQSAEVGPDTMGGRLGAPVPKHVGLPTIHLTNLACTTCHSGPLPQARTTRIQTSRAHAIEFQGPFRGDDALPLVENPVFARRPYDGLIGPQRMTWPAFWARLDGEKITPIMPDAVYKVGKTEFEKKEKDEKYVHLTEERVFGVLDLLAADPKAKGEPVYVAGGKLYRRAAENGKLAASDHPAAEPVAWPIAHDVRPAARSLGSGGCTDCHTSDSPLFFGQVVAESPADLGEPAVIPMYTLLGKDPTELKAWGMSYMFRPFFKVVGFTTAGLIGAVLLVYLLTGLAALARWAARQAPQR
jgi:hypothetical protein